MIIGVITIVGLLVMRLNMPVTSNTSPLSAVTDIALPDGAVVTSVTRTASEILVVTESRELLIFDSQGQTLIRTLALD